MTGVRLVKFSSGPEGEDPHEWGGVFVRVTMNDGNERLHIGVSAAAGRAHETARRRTRTALHHPLRPHRAEGRRAERGTVRAPVAYRGGGAVCILRPLWSRVRAGWPHAVWVLSPSGQLVFTPHDIVYAYGPVEAFRAVLLRRDFVEKPVDIPAPHSHYYHKQFDPVVHDLLAHYTRGNTTRFKNR